MTSSRKSFSLSFCFSEKRKKRKRIRGERERERRGKKRFTNTKREGKPWFVFSLFFHGMIPTQRSNSFQQIINRQICSKKQQERRRRKVFREMTLIPFLRMSLLSLFSPKKVLLPNRHPLLLLLLLLLLPLHCLEWKIGLIFWGKFSSFFAVIDLGPPFLLSSLSLSLSLSPSSFFQIRKPL